jgi:hypothetical protein
LRDLNPFDDELRTFLHVVQVCVFAIALLLLAYVMELA